MTDNVLVSSETKEIMLADGKSYKLSPITLGVLANLEQDFDCSFEELTDRLNKRKAFGYKILLYNLLRKNHPEITKDLVGDLVTPQNMTAISDILSQVINEANKGS